MKQISSPSWVTVQPHKHKCGRKKKTGMFSPGQQKEGGLLSALWTYIRPKWS